MVDDSGQWADSYVHQAGLAPHLSRDAVLLLARRVHQGEDEARSDLVAANRRLVVSIAGRYVCVPPPEDAWEVPAAAQPTHSEQLAPLLRFGEQGLHTAIERFDEAKGFAFPTYATWWIRQAITRGGLGDNLGGVREPRSPHPESPSGAVRLTIPDGDS